MKNDDIKNIHGFVLSWFSHLPRRHALHVTRGGLVGALVARGGSWGLVGTSVAQLCERRPPPLRSRVRVTCIEHLGK